MKGAIPYLLLFLYSIIHSRQYKLIKFCSVEYTPSLSPFHSLLKLTRCSIGNYKLAPVSFQHVIIFWALSHTTYILFQAHCVLSLSQPGIGICPKSMSSLKDDTEKLKSGYELCSLLLSYLCF